MKYNFIVGAAVLILIFLGGVGIWKRYQNRSLDIPEPSPITTASEKFEVSPPPVPNELPAAGISDIEIKRNGITFFEPKHNSIITSPLKISGLANSLNGRLTIKVFDSNERLLGFTNITSCQKDYACPFEATVDFSKPKTATGIIQVNDFSSINSKNKSTSVDIEFLVN